MQMPATGAPKSSIGDSTISEAAIEVAPDETVRPYAYYALAILTLATILNFLDRMILSILATGIKSELQLNDAQLGFLLGTGFAVFYSVVGIAMGRIADGMSRTRLMSLGIATWSVMTALGAAAGGFTSLGLARIGVGIGESTANPCGHSLITDYFPRRYRASALGVYLSGTFIGGASALIGGGYIAGHWQDLCVGASCQLSSWRAALILVALPGLPLAVLVARLREPPRPGMRQLPLGRLLAGELGAAMPPFTMISLFRSGDRGAFRANLGLALLVIFLGWGLGALTGDIAQWAVLALGAYSVVSWGQSQKLRDRPFYKLTFGDPTFVVSMMGGALIATSIGAVSAWAAPYAIRVIGMSPASAGGMLGVTLAITAGIGVAVFGRLNDYWKLRDPRAPLWMAGLSMLGTLPPLALMLTAKTPNAYVLGFTLFALSSSGWAGAFAAMIQDLVLPRMRGGAASAFALVNVIVSAGAGPYLVGKVSSVTGSLAEGMVSVQVFVPVALILLYIASRQLRHETPAARLRRAEAAGEGAYP